MISLSIFFPNQLSFSAPQQSTHESLRFLLTHKPHKPTAAHVLVLFLFPVLALAPALLFLPDISVARLAHFAHFAHFARCMVSCSWLMSPTIFLSINKSHHDQHTFY